MGVFAFFVLAGRLAVQDLELDQGEDRAAQQRAGPDVDHVVDAHGELVAFLRTDGCPFPSIKIAIQKAYTAARDRQESRALGDLARSEDFPLTNFGELGYVGWGGGVPLVIGDEIVGATGISGLPESEDMKLARWAASTVS